MNISWQWLTEIVDLHNIKPEYLAERLTLAGFEVEGINHTNRDNAILEISTTANRTDTLSVIGIAREISAILDRPLIGSVAQSSLSINHQKITRDHLKCNNCIHGIITNLTINQSPDWLQRRLTDSNVIPKNILEDIQNFIYLKWSQHVDFFDLNLNNYDELKDEIKIIYSTKNQQFITKERKNINIINSDILTFNYNDEPIAISGITISSQYATSPKTVNLIAQISHFHPDAIVKTSSELNLVTNNSIIHEKEIGASDLLSAYSECIFLLTKLCQGSISKIKYISENKYLYNKINLHTKQITDVLGTAINQKGICKDKKSVQHIAFKILSQLRFIVQIYPKCIFVEAPLNRKNDISREVDLIEEVSRIYGFDKFTGLIPYNKKQGEIKDKQYKLSHLRSILRTAGLNEVIHSSLVEKKYTEPKVYNPLVREYNSLRCNLLGNIISTNFYNLQQGNSSLEIFEIGRVFQYKYYKYNETMHVAGIIGGNQNIRSNWTDNARELNWFEAKGKMEEIFERFNTEVTWTTVNVSNPVYKDIASYFRPKTTSILHYKDVPVGLFGTLKSSGLKTSFSDINIYGFEISLKEISNNPDKISYFKPYPKYPAITRDITVNIPESVSFEVVINELNKEKSPLIKSVDPVNFYRSKSRKGGYKHLGFRIKYRSPERTLTSEEVDNLENILKNKIHNKFET